MRKVSVIALMTLPLLAACGGVDEAADAGEDAMATDEMAMAGPQEATAMLMTADGTEVGTVTATGSAGGVTMSIEAMNMPAGTHGVHVHQTGACEPDFTAAGGHWNPDESTHGLEGDDGQHAGDMPNLEIAEDGTGSLQYMLTMSATWEGLMDEDGSAFIVHAGPDDQVTDPSGDSGDRIACGVFTAS